MKKITKEDINVAGRIKFKAPDSRMEVKSYLKDDLRRNLGLCQKAASYRSAMYDFLQRTERNRNIYLGKQFEDIIIIGGVAYKAKDAYRKMGKNPMNINIVQSTVRNLIGQYRRDEYKPVIASQNREGQQEAEMMTVALQSVLNENDMPDRNARNFEKFIITGFPVYKITYSYDPLLKKPKIKIRSVSAQSLIINPNARDLFGEDINFVGEIHNYSYNEMMSLYSRYAGEEKIKNISIYIKDEESLSNYNTFSTEELDGLDCLTAGQEINKSRVLEIWQLEGEYRLEVHDSASSDWDVVSLSRLREYEQENANRVRISVEEGIELPLIRLRKIYYQYWKTYHISLVDFSTLYEGETPYDHLSHPYNFYCYPGIDGKVSGLLESLNDIQLLFSRNIMLQDMLIATSAKNLLILPKKTLEASGVTAQQAASQWNRTDGVLVLDTGPDKPTPTQISVTPSATIGINNIIQSTVEMLREVSGVKDSMLGNTPNSGESGTLYALQTSNASTNIIDLISGFNTFVNKTYEKAIKLIKQYWTEKQYVNVIGTEASELAKNYDPAAVRDFEFVSTIGRGENSAVFRDIVNNQLVNLLQSGYISLDMLLQNSSLPYSDRMLQQINSFREELKSGNVPVGAPAWLLQEYQQQAGTQNNPENQALLQEYLQQGTSQNN
jgi:hypothetical protein